MTSLLLEEKTQKSTFGTGKQKSLKKQAHTDAITLLLNFNQLFLSCSLDGTIKIWNKLSFEINSTLDVHPKGVKFAIIDHGRAIISYSEEGFKYWLLDIETGVNVPFPNDNIKFGVKI